MTKNLRGFEKLTTAWKRRAGVFFVLLFLVALSACTTGPKVITGLATEDIAGRPLFHEFLIHPSDENRKIEFYWMKPRVEGKFPVVFVLHGHQDPDRPGGAVWSQGWMQKMVDDHFVAVSISQPGNGNSEGPADYCGPFTQKGVREVMKYFRSLSFIQPERMAIYGVERGATCAAMVASEEPALAALVLQGGMYDLKNDYKNLTDSVGEEEKAMAATLLRETGATDEAFEARSALAHVAGIKSPTLILAGEKDAYAGTSSLNLIQALEAQGTPVKFISYKGQGHDMDVAIPFNDIITFLETQLQTQAAVPLIPASEF